MKKTIFIAVLGMAATVASTYGQGAVAFSSYFANGGAGALTTQFLGGAAVGSTYQAELFYFIGTLSDPVSGNTSSIIADPNASFTALASSITTYTLGGANGVAGYFDGPTVTIPGYTSGPITWQIIAWSGGGSYDAALSRGRSGSFTDSSIALLGNPVGIVGDNATGGQPAFVVAPVPEPTTLALAGLGGLASLVALRRKQS